jgi:multiple sugar transport system permease protein
MKLEAKSNGLANLQWAPSEDRAPPGANGIATSAIMSFIFSRNQFLFSLILSGPKTKTVPVAVYNFISYGKIDWAGIGAAATLIVLPVSIFAFFVRKSIVQGLTMGALKD